MPRQIDSDAEIDSIRMKEQSSAPATPDSGYGQIYCKSDGLYYKGDDGVEVGPLVELKAPDILQIQVFS